MTGIGDKFWVLTVRDAIRLVASRWRRTYGAHSMWATDTKKQSIQRRLDAVDPETATEDDVAAIIGNRSWTEVQCEHCRVIGNPVVTLGEEPGCESRTANICRACLVKAIAAIDSGCECPNEADFSAHHY